jgi:antitoxin FitA
MGRLVQIRDVPEDVHRTLKARAASRGQSLSEYLRRELERSARTPALDDFLDELARREPVELPETPAEAIRELNERGLRDE